jgi:competence protein ComEA
MEAAVSGESLRERLVMLSRAELVGLACVIALLFGGTGLWYLRSLPKEVQVRSAPAAAAVPSAASPSPSAAVLIVDVAGWVRRPGVYEFHEGDRIVDAIDRAGGARPGAALDTLNLAAPLADGVQVLVPRSAPGGVGGVPVDPATGTAVPTTVNVNTASATELEALPGVGEVIAQRIVDYRTQNGPFATVDDLLDVSGIGESTLESMRDQVTV